MDLIRARAWFLMACGAAILTVGCSQGAALSPTSPTAIGRGATATAADASGFSAVSLVDDESAATAHGSAFQSQKAKDKDKRGGRSDDSESDSGQYSEDAADQDSDEDSVRDDQDSEKGDADAMRQGPGPGHRANVAGFVTAISGDTFTVRGISVKVSDTTSIRHGRRVRTLAAIAVGGHVVAHGSMSADGKTLLASEVKVQPAGRN